MICDKCKKNEATIHLIRTVNGVTNEAHLCAECARQEDIMPETFSLQNLLSGFASVQSAASRCPNCGTTLSEFRRTGFLGCPQCYKAFSSQVGPMLLAVHGASAHRGRGPASKAEAPETGVENLKAALNKAVAEERYEEAARIRDRIKLMEQEGKAKNG